MRSAPADPARTRGAVACLALTVLLCLVLSACSGGDSIPPPPAATGDSTTRDAAASTTVESLEAALRDHDAAAASALGSGPGTELLRAAATNVRGLGLVGVSLRFVEDRSDDTEAPAAPGAWLATVEVRYRIDGWDRAATTDETTFVFAPVAGEQRVVGIGDDDGRTPLWLDGPVTRLAKGRTLVLTRAGSPARYSGLALHAISDVAKVLPAWKGPLVVEVPETQDELDHALGATGDEYSNIAAVTASVDGSQVSTAPVHVFLNPGVFDPLGAKAAQVVISHESTHVATGATFAHATLPTWLKEGFADYVALAHAGIPVSVAGAQILGEIRKNGAPKQLPTAEDLAPTAAGLGATYEEAWLATRFVAVSYGEAKLVRFYEAISSGEKPEAAFARILGTTETAFTKAWAADSKRLAG